MENNQALCLTKPNLFGSIGYGKIDFPTGAGFVPTDNQGGTIDVRGEALWKGLGNKAMQFWAYQFCSPLSSVIDRLANNWINGKLMFLKDNDDEYTLPAARRVKDLFMKPNPLDDYYQFFGTQQVYKKIFGFALVYCYKPASADDNTYTKYMWNLNPYFCTPVLNENFDIYTDPRPIKAWQITIYGKQYEIPAEKILVIKDGYLDYNWTGLPLSKVAGLDWAISNICAAMEADNVLLRKKGPLGFISHQPPSDNVSGYVPMFPEEKNEMQKDLSQYGMSWSQFQYVITRQGVKWNPMSFNVKDLDTKGTIREGIDMICDRFSYPAELMSGKNATYENRTSAEKYCIQNVTMPESQRDDMVYTMYFGLDNFNVYHDYTKIPVMQENMIGLGEGMKYLNEAYQLQFTSNLITLNQWRTLSEIDTVIGDDIYFNSKEYNDKYGKYAPKAVKSNAKSQPAQKV